MNSFVPVTFAILHYITLHDTLLRHSVTCFFYLIACLDVSLSIQTSILFIYFYHLFIHFIQVEQTACAVLDMFPDLELAVEEGTL